MATVSTIDKIRARSGEAHRAEAAARQQGRSKCGAHKLGGGGHPGVYLVEFSEIRGLSDF